jgi:hypothetical protein
MGRTYRKRKRAARQKYPMDKMWELPVFSDHTMHSSQIR